MQPSLRRPRNVPGESPRLGPLEVPLPLVGEIGADFRPHFDGFEDTDRVGDSGVLYRDGLCYAY